MSEQEQKASFTLDPVLSPEANIARFLDHLETVDPELGKLLKENIDLVFPGVLSRSEARVALNTQVATALDAIALKSI